MKMFEEIKTIVAENLGVEEKLQKPFVLAR